MSKNVIDLYKMNLQLFALSPLNTSTDGALSVEQKTFYERTLLERLLPNLIHAQFGQKKGIPKKNGKTIEFRRFAALAQANFTLTEGVTPNGQSMSATAITASVTQHGNYILITDLLDLTALDPILDEAAELLGEQAGEYIDTLVRDVLVAGTNVMYAKKMKYHADGTLIPDTAAGVLAARNTVTNLHCMGVDTIRTGKRIMQRNRVRPYKGERSQTGKGEYVVVFHGDALYDVENDKKWVDVRNYQDKDAHYSGEVGKVYGVRFVQSDLAKIFTGAGAASGGAEAYDVYAALMIGSDAFGIIDIAGSGNVEYIVKTLGSEGSGDPLNQRQTTAWKVMFTTKILQDYAILRIEHGFTEDAKTTAAS